MILDESWYIKCKAAPFWAVGLFFKKNKIILVCNGIVSSSISWLKYLSAMYGYQARFYDFIVMFKLSLLVGVLVSQSATRLFLDITTF